MSRFSNLLRSSLTLLQLHILVKEPGQSGLTDYYTHTFSPHAFNYVHDHNYSLCDVQIFLVTRLLFSVQFLFISLV